MKLQFITNIPHKVDVCYLDMFLFAPTLLIGYETHD